MADALKKKRFDDALEAAREVNDPIARSLGQWLYFIAEDPDLSPWDADAFLDLHGDWPAASRIQTHAEKQFSSRPRTEDVLAFYETRDPVSGKGKITLARALFDKGEDDAGQIYLRDAWVNDNFTLSDERSILSSFGKRLTKEDHAARVDRLLWARQVTAARRIFSRLDSNERAKAQARASFIVGAADAPARYGR
ncbi:MAG: hypothetical protein ACX939_13140, partial [Hyphococcus sp.]